MATIYASETGGTVHHEGEALRTFKLQTAINRLTPGDTLCVLPGRYTQPVTISEGGRRDAPIKIKGSADGRTVFDGEQEKESAINDFDPMDDDFAFIKIISAHWIEISGIKFERCWPSSVFIRGSKHIDISECEILGGRFGVYARNRRLLGKARHISLRNIKWVQDLDHDMWEGRITWMDVKQITPTETDARYLNGALFGSYDIKGPVTIERCDLSHAFNGIRMDARNRSTTRNRNADVRIVRNKFSYIRDNAVEPEKVAENLFVLDNVFFNVHAVFSLDGVAGKNWYYIGNRILNTRKPGLEGQPNRGGKIFKLHSEGPYPSKNFIAVFNSVQTRTTYIKSGQTRELQHVANAIGICSQGPDCDTDRKMFGEDFTWHPSLSFSGDLCDHPGFPNALNAQGYDVSGIPAPGGAFNIPATLATSHDGSIDWDGQLNLKAGSLGMGASEEVSVRLPDGSEIHIAAGRDIGAPAPDELLEIGTPDAPLVG